MGLIIFYEDGTSFESLATYMQNGELYTHNHFGAGYRPSEGNTKEVKIYGVNGGEPIAVVPGAMIQRTDVAGSTNYSTYKLQSIDLSSRGLVGASYGNGDLLSNGDGITIPRWTRTAPRQATDGTVVMAPVPEEGITFLSSTITDIIRDPIIGYRAYVDLYTENGDSGGGLWRDGSVFGNLRSIDEPTGLSVFDLAHP